MLEKDFDKMKSHQQLLKGALPAAQMAVEFLQEKLKNHEYINILMTKHGDERTQERVISNREILEVIKTGHAIDFQNCFTFEEDGFVNVLLMRHVKIGEDTRYIHVAISIYDERVYVKTVYDPSSRGDRWEADMKTRIFYK